MAIISPNPAMHDLKIAFQESTLVFPSQQTQKKSLFLSNIDQFLNFNIATVHFFHTNPDFPPENVAKRLKIAVERVLVPYDFIAGRLKWNHQLRRLEIDCNAAGAGFVVASSELSLDEIGDLACPNLGFRQLAVETLSNLDGDQPICIFQVTSFKCGGFAIGMSNNHILLDGLSAKMFQENLASLTFEDDETPPLIPYHDRRLLAARAPPLVTFPHPEFLKLDSPLVDFECKQDLDVKVLKLSSGDIDCLKAEAKATSADYNAATLKITTFNVVAALIWRCRALSLYDIEQDRDRAVTILNVMDVRRRINPPLPPEYCGNAILTAYSSARCKEIGQAPLSELVEMVSEGQQRVSDESVKSAIDWLEINRGIPRGDCIVTSWLRLGLDQVVFPWGKPVYSGPVMNRMEHLCWVYPVVDGVNVLIQRPPEEMQRFQSHFHNFFQHFS